MAAAANADSPDAAAGAATYASAAAMVWHSSSMATEIPVTQRRVVVERIIRPYYPVL